MTTLRDLTRDAVDRSDFLDGQKTVALHEEHFDAALDRWHAALPDDVGVAEQVALRAIRRANAAGGTPASLLAAAEAVSDALTLGSTAPALLASHAKLPRDTRTLRPAGASSR